MKEHDKATKDRKEPSDAAGASRLREDIDRGGAGDKVAFVDPAAAPLGTDDEAAGHPPTRGQVRTARLQEGGRTSDKGEKGSLAARNSGMPWWKAGAVVVLGMALLGVALLLK